MVDVSSLLHGKNSKLFMLGGAAVGVLVVVEYRKSKLNVASAPVTDSGDPTDYSADASSSDYSSYGSADTAGMFGYVDPSTGATITGGGSVVTSLSTNAQWSQIVQAMLTQQGYSSVDVAAAVGHYLVGTAMSAQQWEIVQAGIALEGYPPQSVPPPNVAPINSGGAVVPKDGYYVQIPTNRNLYYQVSGGKLFNLRPVTVAALQKQGVKFTPALSNNAIFKLPKGTPNPI